MLLLIFTIGFDQHVRDREEACGGFWGSPLRADYRVVFGL
jgi:hypothetical protein